MTEVVIYDVQNSNSAAWYQIRHVPKEKEIEKDEIKITVIPKKSLFLKFKRFLFPRLKEGDKVKAALSIKCIRACTDTKIGSSIGATMGRFIMY